MSFEQFPTPSGVGSLTRWLGKLQDRVSSLENQGKGRERDRRFVVFGTDLDMVRPVGVPVVVWVGKGVPKNKLATDLVVQATQ